MSRGSTPSLSFPNSTVTQQVSLGSGTVFIGGMYSEFATLNGRPAMKRTSPKYGNAVFLYFCGGAWMFALKYPPSSGCEDSVRLFQSDSCLGIAPDELSYALLARISTAVPHQPTAGPHANGVSKASSMSVERSNTSSSSASVSRSQAKPVADLLAVVTNQHLGWTVWRSDVVALLHATRTADYPPSASLQNVGPLLISCDRRATCPCLSVTLCSSGDVGGRAPLGVFRMRSEGRLFVDGEPAYVFDAHAADLTEAQQALLAQLSVDPAALMIHYHNNTQTWVVSDSSRLSRIWKRVGGAQDNSGAVAYQSRISATKDADLARLGVVAVSLAALNYRMHLELLLSNTVAFRVLESAVLTLQMECEASCITRSVTRSLAIPRLPVLWRPLSTDGVPLALYVNTLPRDTAASGSTWYDVISPSSLSGVNGTIVRVTPTSFTTMRTVAYAGGAERTASRKDSDNLLLVSVELKPAVGSWYGFFVGDNATTYVTDSTRFAYVEEYYSPPKYVDSLGRPWRYMRNANFPSSVQRNATTLSAQELDRLGVDAPIARQALRSSNTILLVVLSNLSRSDILALSTSTISSGAVPYMRADVLITSYVAALAGGCGSVSVTWNGALLDELPLIQCRGAFSRMTFFLPTTNSFALVRNDNTIVVRFGAKSGAESLGVSSISLAYVERSSPLCTVGDRIVQCTCRGAPNYAWCAAGQSCFSGMCGACPTGWVFHSGSCFNIRVDRLPFSKAVQLCNSMSANLPSFHNEAARRFLASLGSTGSSVWTGGVYVPAHARVYWQDATDTAWDDNSWWMTNSTWELLSPLSRGCVAVKTDTSTPVITDCDEFFDVVCEKSMCVNFTSSYLRALDGTQLTALNVSDLYPANGLPSSENVDQAFMLHIGTNGGLIVRPLGIYHYVQFCVALNASTYAVSSNRSIRVSHYTDDQLTDTSRIYEEWAQPAVCVDTLPIQKLGTLATLLELRGFKEGSSASASIVLWNAKVCRAPSMEGRCPRDWRPTTEGLCVFYVAQPATFSNATLTCKHLGGSIAEANTYARSLHFWALSSFIAYWVGAIAVGTQSVWKWNSGAVVAIPSGITGSTSLAAQLSYCLASEGPLWAMQLCVGTLPYFCVREATVTNTLTQSFTLSQPPSTTATQEITATEAAPLSLSQPLTKSISVSSSITPTVVLPITATMSKTLSGTTSQELPIVPGNITLLSDPEVSFDIFFSGYQLIVRIDGDAFRYHDIVYHISSSLWEDHWGLGVAWAAEYVKDFVQPSVSEDYFNLTLGPYDYFEVANDENVLVTFDTASSFRSGVQPHGLPIRLRFTTSSGCGTECFLSRVARYGSLGVLVVNVLIGGDFTYVLDYSSSSVAYEANCNVEATDMPWIIHPLQFSVGESKYRYAYGCAVANTLSLVFCLILHWAAFVRYRLLNYSLHSAMATVFFPGLLYFPLTLLAPGSIAGSIIVLAYGTMVEKFTAGLMLLATVGIFVLFVPVALSTARFRAKFHRNPAMDDPYWKTDVAHHWLGDVGTWVSTDSEGNFARRYYGLFTDYRFQMQWFGFYQLVAVCLMALVQWVPAQTSTSCIVDSSVLAVVLVFHVMVIMYFRPFRIRIHRVVSCVVCSLQLMSLVCQIFFQLFPSKRIDLFRRGFALASFGFLGVGMIPFIANRIAQRYSRDRFPPFIVPKEVESTNTRFTSNVMQDTQWKMMTELQSGLLSVAEVTHLRTLNAVHRSAMMSEEEHAAESLQKDEQMKNITFLQDAQLLQQAKTKGLTEREEKILRTMKLLDTINVKAEYSTASALHRREEPSRPVLPKGPPPSSGVTNPIGRYYVPKLPQHHEMTQEDREKLIAFYEGIAAQHNTSLDHAEADRQFGPPLQCDAFTILRSPPTSHQLSLSRKQSRASLTVTAEPQIPHPQQLFLPSSDEL